MKRYLNSSSIVDFDDKDVKSLARKLAQNCQNDEEIAKNCFLYVRDEIRHSGDHKDDVTTCKASDVLKYKGGWCYAKSHLLCALLRANDIPAGFCYQRLKCGEYKDDIFCLHGLNALYLEKHGWYRVDARGNKEGVCADFTPPIEKLAFSLQKDENDIEKIYEEPLEIVVKTLQRYKGYEQVVNNLPDQIRLI